MRTAENRWIATQDQLIKIDFVDIAVGHHNEIVSGWNGNDWKFLGSTLHRTICHVTVPSEYRAQRTATYIRPVKKDHEFWNTGNTHNQVAISHPLGANCLGITRRTATFVFAPFVYCVLICFAFYTSSHQNGAEQTASQKQPHLGSVLKQITRPTQNRKKQNKEKVLFVFQLSTFSE